MLGTGGAFSGLLDPANEILWKDAGLFIPDEELRSKFGVGGINDSGASTHGCDQIRDYDIPDTHASLEPLYEREILASVDECLSAELVCPRGDILSGTRKYLDQKKQTGIRDVVKPWKPRKRSPQMVLGDDIGLDAVTRMSLAALVGKFSYWSCSSNDIESFVKEQWFPVLTYMPEVYILSRGWYCFLFKSLEDTEAILSKIWIRGKGSLMLKRWCHKFNPVKEILHIRHLWVHILDCPLFLWNMAALLLSEIIWVDLSMWNSHYWRGWTVELARYMWRLILLGAWWRISTLFGVGSILLLSWITGDFHFGVRHATRWGT